MKRILSIVLALAMVISMLPTMTLFASAAENTIVDEYLFTAPSHGYSALTGMYNSTTLGTNAALDSTKTGVSSKWGFVNQASGSTVSADINNFLWTINLADGTSADFDGTQATVKTVVFEIQPSKTGSFVPNISFLTENSGGKYDVLFFEAPASTWQCPTIAWGNKAIRNNVAAKAATTKIGSFDAYGNGELKTVSFSKVSVDASKKYYLVLLLNGANANIKKDIYTTASRYFITLKLRSFSLSEQAISEKPTLSYNITPGAYHEDAIANYASRQASTAATAGSEIDNLELMYVSYKEKISGVAPMLDFAKTEGYEIVGRMPMDNGPSIKDAGYATQLKIATDSAGNAYEAASYASRPWVAIKLNVPYGGRFKLSASNAFTKSHPVVAGVVSLGEQKNGAEKGVFDKGTVAKVYFGNANFAITNKASSGGVTNGALFGDFVTVADEVGYYDVNNLATSADAPYISDIGYIDVPKAGEYYLFFDIDKDAIAKNAKSWYRSSTTYQMFLLSGITLTPVDETKPAYTRLDLNGTHTIGKDKTAPSTWNTYGFDIVAEKTTTGISRKSSVTLANGTALPYQQIQIAGDPWQTRPDSQEAMFTIRKNFSAAGYYAIEMLGYKWSAGSDFAVYVNGEYAGDYNIFETGSALSVGEKKKLNTLYIPAGDVEISFRTRVKHYATPNFVPIWMEFTPVDISELKAEKIENNIASKLIVDEENTFSAKIKMNDGSYLGMGLNNSAEADTKKTVAVTADSDVVAITDLVYAQAEAENDISFKVTGKKVGTTNVNITSSIDGVTYTETVPVTVVPVPALETVEVSFEKAAIPATRTTSTSLKLISNTEGMEWTKESTAVYESGNPDVATVDAATGVVTGISEGSAEIIAHVTSDGKTVTGKATITVLPEPVLESITAELENDMLLVGDTTKITVSGMMDDGIAADMTDATYRFVSTDESIATVDEEGNISTVSDGSAVITVMATTAKGESANTTVVVNVYATMPTFTVDFAKSTYNGDRSAPTITPGYTIVREETDTTMWRLGVAQNTGLQAAYMWICGGMWPATSTITNNALTILVDLPYEHDYNLKIHGAGWHQTGIFSVFVDGVYAGDYNCYNPNVTTSTDLGPVSLNTLHLTKGEHKISFRSRKKYYSTANVISIAKIIFEPVAKSGTALSGVNDTIPEELAIGEVYDASAYIEMSDGSALHYGINNDGSADSGKSLSIESDNTSALAISGFANYILGATGKIPFTLKGNAEGVANITLNADVDGEKFSKTVTLTVKDDPIASISATTEAEEVFLGDKTMLTAKTYLKSGREIDRKNAPVTYATEDTDVITIEGDMLTTVATGKATVRASAIFNGKTVETSFELEVLPEGMTAVEATSGGSEKIRLTSNEEDKYPLSIVAISNLGNEIDLSDAEITAVSLTPEIAEVGAEVYPVNGGEFGNYIKPIAEGKAIFEVTVKVDGRIRTKTVELPVVKAKEAASYMTAEKAAIAKENASKYDWAKSTIDTAVREAEKYVGREDVLYDMIASNEVPRGFGVGPEADPDMYHCRYCGEDLQEKYGSYPWKHNPFTKPWKIQCPDCKREFPTNDFGSFYKLGLNEYGEFERMLALERHHELFGDQTIEAPGKEGSETWYAYYGYGVPGGYLTNELYNNLESVKTINCKQGLREGEKTETWGVDDGMGYVPRKADGTPYMTGNGLHERHTYIAEYMHYGIFSKTAGDNGGVIYEAVRTCSNAYFYTGDKKYGRTAAILLDRIADFYPGYDLSVFGKDVWNSHGGSRVGKRLGRIWETSHARNDVQAYDMVFDLYEDPYVLRFIQGKAKTWKMRYSKQTASQIRQSIEDGLVRETLEGIRNNQINGNFGMAQSTNAIAAIVLDSMPETKEWLDYLMAPGWQASRAPVAGGGLNEIYIDRVDSDGQSDEASDYGLLWLSYSGTVNNILSGYDKYPAANLKNNPKYVQMYYALLPMYAAPSYSVQIGDTGATASNTHWITSGYATNGWKETGDPIFAQMMYMLNGNTAKGLHYSITDKDAGRLEKEVQAVIDEYGTTELDSDIQTGFGYAILRDGKSYSNVTEPTSTETTRNAWMYFGSNGGHGHRDTLNLGMTAFGLNVLPDLGYPEATGNTPHRLQWTSNTLSHNTVVVNEKRQDVNMEVRGKVLHYEDADQVQIIDVDASYVYPDAEEYRRSVVMVNIDDANSYYVDLFRVLGGENHVYSLHATSNEIAETVGLNGLTPQVDENGDYVGSFAGADVPYGNDPNSPNSATYETVYPRGYTWLKNVDRYASADDKFEVDFAIKDFNKAVKDSKGIHLRATMLNGANKEKGATTKVAIMDGLPPQKAENKNIDKLKYVLVENAGDNLNTVFTTVFEPYKVNRTISSIEELVPTVEGRESAKDAHRVVKVELANGRCDYIFYSTNKNVTYTVVDGDNTIAFRGFVGVYSVKDGKNIYKYVLDGDIIGDATGTKSAIEGTLLSFTKELSFENKLEIMPTAEVTDSEISSLAGKLVVIDNGALTRDGAWKILSAERNGENIVLNVGRVTPIRKYIDANDTAKGYEYNVEVGQTATIPLSVSEDYAPVFDPMKEDITTSAGSSISVKVNATSELDGVTVTYSEEKMPRGAILDEATGIITWKPDASQIGDNHFAINATDSDGRISTMHFIITVYGSTSGGTTTPTTPETPSTPSEPSIPTTPTTPSTPGASGGSGGGGGGGGAPAPGTPSVPETPTTPSEPQTPSVDASKRFIDLGNHGWAADAINSLADEGIIKGTSENTFSPAANITRADFAVLLVRAFKLASENTENFADVSSSDYFAKELAVARNTGLVNGIGENKFAPRNNITRQDMMVIVYRALAGMKKLNVGDGVLDVPQASDFDTVSDYAKDAVSALVNAKLVNGKNGLIDPTANTTRAEVAVLISRILDFVK